MSRGRFIHGEVANPSHSSRVLSASLSSDFRDSASVREPCNPQNTHPPISRGRYIPGEVAKHPIPLEFPVHQSAGSRFKTIRISHRLSQSDKKWILSNCFGYPVHRCLVGILLQESGTFIISHRFFQLDENWNYFSNVAELWSLEEVTLVVFLLQGS